MNADKQVEVRLLGPFEITAGGAVIPIGSAKQRLLLAMLVINQQRPLSVDVIAEELWGGQPPASVAAAVQTLVYRLRRCLSVDGVEESVELRATPAGYLLDVDVSRLDSHRFEALAGRARAALGTGALDKGAALFSQALALWRGPALGDLADRPFCRIEAARLDEARRDAVEEWAEVQLAAGRPAATLTILEPHLALHPLRERAWGRLMVALYRLGRQAEALRAYQDIRRLLRDELGLEPTPALRDLEQKILEQSSDLDDPLTLVGGAPSLVTRGQARPEAEPLPGPDVPLENLPMAVTSFIGRRRELEELEMLIATCRLLTLTGVGGAGKTRLALQLAALVRHRFADGVWLVELGSISDPSLVATEVMEAVGILVGGLGLEGLAPEDRLCEYLRRRSVLLVLDTCEHVVTAVSDLVGPILARCPGVTILATSREVLGVQGEVPWPLPGLTLPPAGAERPDDLARSDAVALLCARAASAQPGFALTEANAGAVAKICRRLDGIPLALELAATRIRLLGAHQVAERLDDRFRLLSDGGRRVVSRHQTLRATMDWSYELLPAAERSLLRRLAVFPQSFDVEAVEGVWDHDTAGAKADVLDLLARLVDKSLVVLESNGADVRYRLLDTVREYGAEKLAETDERHAAYEAHRDHFLGTALARHHRQAEAGIGPWWETSWMVRVDEERDNFHTALDWSVAVGDHRAAVVLGAALWPYWLFWRGFLGTPYHRLEQALSGPEPVLDAFRFEALLGLRVAIIRSGDGDPGRADELLKEAQGLSRSLNDPMTEARIRYYLGQTAHTSGAVTEGYRELARSVALAEKAGYGWGLAWGHHELGWAAMAAGRIDEAGRHFQQALAPIEGLENDVVRVHALAGLATVMASTGSTDQAQALAEEAVAAARTLPLRQMLVAALVRAAEVAVLTDRPQRGRAVLTEVLGILGDLGARRWVADTLEATALILDAYGRRAATARLLSTSDALRLTLHEPQIALPALSARLARCRERVDAAGGGGTTAPPVCLDSLPEILDLARAELEAMPPVATPNSELRSSTARP